MRGESVISLSALRNYPHPSPLPGRERGLAATHYQRQKLVPKDEEGRSPGRYFPGSVAPTKINAIIAEVSERLLHA